MGPGAPGASGLNAPVPRQRKRAISYHSSSAQYFNRSRYTVGKLIVISILQLLLVKLGGHDMVDDTFRAVLVWLASMLDRLNLTLFGRYQRYLKSLGVFSVFQGHDREEAFSTALRQSRPLGKQCHSSQNADAECRGTPRKAAPQNADTHTTVKNPTRIREVFL